MCGRSSNSPAPNRAAGCASPLRMPTDTFRPLGILAGGGTLPRRVAEAAAAQGRPFCVVALAGKHDPAPGGGFPHIALRIGEAGRITAEMKKAGVVDLVRAGGVRRPSLSELGLDWRGVRFF